MQKRAPDYLHFQFECGILLKVVPLCCTPAWAINFVPHGVDKSTENRPQLELDKCDSIQSGVFSSNGVRLARALRQDSIHRSRQNQSNINTGMRKNPVARGGPRGVLHFSVSSTYSTRIQPTVTELRMEEAYNNAATAAKNAIQPAVAVRGACPRAVRGLRDPCWARAQGVAVWRRTAALSRAGHSQDAPLSERGWRRMEGCMGRLTAWIGRDGSSG